MYLPGKKTEKREIDDEARMTFIEHLAELRTRIVRSAIALFIAFIICYAFSNQLFEIIKRPLTPSQEAAIAKQESPAKDGAGQGASTAPPKNDAQAPQAAAKWTVLNPMESFLVKLKISMYAGFLLASPIVIYQLCAFIFPGLKPNERNLAKIMIFGCAGFATFGVLVGYFAVFPFVLLYMTEFVPPGVELQFRMNETISQIVLFLVGFAGAFQFPMVVLSLVYLGLLHPRTLKKYRRLNIVIMAIAAAILTPPDPVSMMMMLTPMLILYEMSIWLSYIVLRRKAAPETTA